MSLNQSLISDFSVYSRWSQRTKNKRYRVYNWRKHEANKIKYLHFHSVLTICTQTGTCDTWSDDLVFFSAAFDGFSEFTKN